MSTFRIFINFYSHNEAKNIVQLIEHIFLLLKNGASDFSLLQNIQLGSKATQPPIQ
jgi:hypothetical protein